MAQITFDPNNPDDVKLVKQLLGGSVAVSTTPVADAPISATQIDRELDAQSEPAQTHDADATDCHGMTWNAEIHSDPATINADGSWRARRGRKDEYDAAIAAHKAGATADAGQAMAAMPAAPAPTAMPAAPAPTAPAAPVAYEDMARRFIGMMNDKKIGDFAVVYNDLGVSYDDLETNQTSINRLSKYMDALDAGNDHAACVQAALA